jgi:hypothetical protein
VCVPWFGDDFDSRKEEKRMRMEEGRERDEMGGASHVCDILSF